MSLSLEEPDMPVIVRHLSGKYSGAQGIAVDLRTAAGQIEDLDLFAA